MSKYMFRERTPRPVSKPAALLGVAILAAFAGAIVVFMPEPETSASRSIDDEVKSCHQLGKLPTVLLTADGKPKAVLCEER